MINAMMDFILNRAQERSTWVGLISMLGSVGIAFKPEMAEAIALVGVAGAGLVLAITKDMADKPKADPKA